MPKSRRAFDANLSGYTILQVVPELNLGGAEKTTLEIARAISAAGGRALVATQGGLLARDIQRAGGKIVNLPVKSKNPITIVANIFRLFRLIKKENVDIIHARSRAPAWSCLYAAKYAKIPYMATYHSKVHAAPRLKVFYNSVLTRARLVIANSHFTAEAILRVHAITKDRIRIIPRGCDCDAHARAHFTKERAARIRKLWGLSRQDFVILCPARLTAWKGQAVLIDALGRLKTKIKPIVVLAGDAQGRTAYLSALHRQVIAQGLQERVIFAGHVRDMPLAYAASNMVVVPSIEAEPFGRTIIEAQAARLPVITSDAGGGRETVKTGLENNAEKNGMTGWLVPPGDGAALAAAIDKALALSPKLLAQIGKNGRAHVLAHYTDEQMCRATLDVYQEVKHAASTRKTR